MSYSLSLEFSPVFLKNPISCGLFSYFLESEFSCENLLFWHAVENLKQITDVTKVPSAANEIFNKYIANGSPDAVNLGFTVVQSLQVKLRDLLLKIETRLSAADGAVSTRDFLQRGDKQKEKGSHSNRNWGWGSEHNPSVEEQVDQYMNASFQVDLEDEIVDTTSERVEVGTEADRTEPDVVADSDLMGLYKQLHGIFDEAQEHILKKERK